MAQINHCVRVFFVCVSMRRPLQSVQKTPFFPPFKLLVCVCVTYCLYRATLYIELSEDLCRVNSTLKICEEMAIGVEVMIWTYEWISWTRSVHWFRAGQKCRVQRKVTASSVSLFEGKASWCGYSAWVGKNSTQLVMKHICHFFNIAREDLCGNGLFRLFNFFA